LPHFGFAVEFQAVRTLLIGAIAILVLAETAGCGPYLSHGASQALAAVRVGMTREEVIKQLGEPHVHEVVGKTELLTYRPDWTVKAAPKQSPLAISEGKVVGLGDIYAAKVRQDFRFANAAVK
jgi:hypothetical protein